MRRLVVCLLAAPLGWGCVKPEPPRHQPPTSVPVTLDAFQSLRWLQGTWRGTAAGSAPFYESYIFLNDSTIRGFSYADSTFAQASDSSVIALAGGQVTYTSSDAVWLATRLDSTAIRFDPETGGTNSVIWTEESRDRWTARLEWSDSASGHAPTAYLLERVGH